MAKPKTSKMIEFKETIESVPSTTTSLLIGINYLNAIDGEVTRLNSIIFKEYQDSMIVYTDKELKAYITKLQGEVQDNKMEVREANRLIREAKNPTSSIAKPKKVSRRTIIEAMAKKSLPLKIEEL